MKHRRNWIIGIALSLTGAFIALQTVSAPEQEAFPSSTEIASSTETPATESDSPPSQPQGCAYSWAYRDAPDLTRMLNAQIKALNPNASATATQFGEDCHRTDGGVTFGVMQTDFKVRLLVNDLTKEEEFGNWVAQVLNVVTGIPRKEIPGPNYGFVEFWFEKNESEHITFRVQIQEYLNNAQGKSGAELFQMFNANP